MKRLLQPAFAFVVLLIICSQQLYSSTPKVDTTNQTNNLVAFAKLYGLVRFYHPSKTALKTDWGQFILYGVEQVLLAKNTDDTKALLRQLFNPIAPGLVIYSDPLPSGNPIFISKVSYWEHSGYNYLKDEVHPSNIFKSKVVTTNSKNLPNALVNQPLLNTQLTDGIYIQLPLIVPNYGKALPQSYQLTNDADSALLIHIANLIITWNEIGHFSPNLSPEVDWDAVLITSLEKLFAQPNDQGFQFAMMYMLGTVGDGHLVIRKNGVWQRIYKTYTPIFTGIIDDTVTVMATFVDTLGVSIGDYITHVDGLPIEDHLELIATRDIYFTPHNAKRRYQAGNSCLNGFDTSTVEVTLVDSNGMAKNMLLQRRESWPTNSACSARLGNVIEQEPGIYYVNLCYLTQEDLKYFLPKFTAAKGLVLDLRGYPVDIMAARNLIRHFSTETLVGMKRVVPKVYGPAEYGYTPDTTGSFNWTFKPLSPTISCPKVIITDYNAQSNAEAILELIRDDEQVTIIGQATTGTNGVSNYIQLLNGYSVNYTGMLITNKDGSAFHGIGIAPDVHCVQTRAAFMSNPVVDLCRAEALRILKETIAKP